jgi:hypothetical protein
MAGGGGSMKDLTTGSIAKNILQMAVPIAAGMFFQTLYFLIDLYFVAGLGDAAIAGVGAAGNVMFIVFALTQVLGVGTVALISHAVGRKDQADATLIFNQSLVLSGTCALITLIVGYGVGQAYVRTLGSDAATVLAGTTYLYWFLPSLALQFALVAMGSALRGTGIVQPTMIVQVVTVLLNAALAPVLIAGWGTGHAFGVAGAGLASSLSVGAGVMMLPLYFHRLEKYVAFDASAWRPRLGAWGRLLRFWHRSATHAEHVSAGDGGGIRDGAHRRTKLRRGAERARARNLWSCRVDRHLHHGGLDAILSVGRGLGCSRVHGPAGCRGRRYAVPAGHFLELRGIGAGVHLFGGVPGIGQHHTGGAEFGKSPGQRGMRPAVEPAR